MVTEANKHQKMLPSVVSCLLWYNYMTWKWIWPSHQSKCTSTYLCEVQCSFPRLVLRRWGTQQWSTQEPQSSFKEYIWWGL